LQNFQARCFGIHLAGTAYQDSVGEASHENDDGLGYYADGVKRTLTDEQVAMFRHSEIQAILRKRRRTRENSHSSQHRRVDVEAAGPEHNDSIEQESLSALEDEGEYARFLEKEQDQLRNDRVVKKGKRSGTAHGARHYIHEEGRETGIELHRAIVPSEGLDYGEDTAVSNSSIQVVVGQRTQLERGRKRIVYEDEQGIDAVTSTPGSTPGGEKPGIPAEAKIFLWPKINI